MTALLIIGCVPLGFVLADVVRDWRRLLREISGASMAGLPKRPAKWQIGLAYAAVLLLLAKTYPF